MAHKWRRTGREKSERICQKCGVVQRRERQGDSRYYAFRPKFPRCLPPEEDPENLDDEEVYLQYRLRQRRKARAIQ